MESIKRLRKKHNENQQKLADAIGVSRSTVSMWETAGSQPDNDMLNKLADHFHVTVDYILGRDEQKKEPATGEGDGMSDMERFLFNWLKGLSKEEFEAAQAYIQGRRDAQKG